MVAHPAAENRRFRTATKTYQIRYSEMPQCARIRFQGPQASNALASMSTDAGLRSVVLHIFRANRLDLQKSTRQLGPPLPKKRIRRHHAIPNNDMRHCHDLACRVVGATSILRTESATTPPTSILRQKPGHGTFSAGNGINQRGWIAGAATLANNTQHATFWIDGLTFDLGTLGGPNSSVPFPIKDDRGLVAGMADTSTMDPAHENFCAFGDGYELRHSCGATA